MKKITPAARRERPFPVPIDENTGHARDHEQDKNEKRALQSAEYKCGRAAISMYRASINSCDLGELC